MTRNSALRLGRSITRQLHQSTTTTASRSLLHPSRLSTLFKAAPAHSFQAYREFSISPASLKGLSPETEDPQPKEAESNIQATQPVDLTIEAYHEVADSYMNSMVERMEEMQEENDEVDVEYTAGVLNFVHPSHGTYVINKQPPNKQIWLSSPISGPKRYDYVLLSEGQDSKEGTGAGEWVYLRDMSTLSSLLLSEVGIDLSEKLPPAA